MHIIHIAYNKYMTDWMLQHGLTLYDFASEILSYYKENLPESNKEFPVGKITNNWEHKVGFNGMLYASYEEFTNNEFKNEDYIRQILTTDEFIEWQNYWLNKKN